MTIKQTKRPKLADVLKELKKDIGIAYNSVQIGEIVSFDSTNQTASIRLAIKKILSEQPDGSKVYAEHPVLMECPVMTLFGGDSFLSLPVAVGDNCIVLFCDREIDEWLYNGGVNPPVSKRLHDISDAIAIVGIRSFQNSIADFLANGIRLSFASNSRISLTDNQIESIAGLFKHNGAMIVTGNLDCQGTLKAGNGATGTFNIVTVQNGIVTGGS